MNEEWVKESGCADNWTRVCGCVGVRVEVEMCSGKWMEREKRKRERLCEKKREVDPKQFVWGGRGTTDDL